MSTALSMCAGSAAASYHVRRASHIPRVCLRPGSNVIRRQALPRPTVRSGCRKVAHVAGFARDGFEELVAAGVAATDLASLQRADDAWRALCKGRSAEARQVVHRHAGRCSQQVPASDTYDVVVLGGTLGILLATALLADSASSPSTHPLRVAVVERGKLTGRDQEWNITYSDLQVFVELGVLTAAEVDSVVATRYSNVRMGVSAGPAYRISGVMDCGVSPRLLLDLVSRKFKELGGTILEGASFNQLDVYDDLALLSLQSTSTSSTNTSTTSPAGGAGGANAAFMPVTGAASTAGPGAAAAKASPAVPVLLSAQLVLDALGGFSPISMQVRGQQQPTSAMLLVGSCAEVVPGDGAGDTADVLWAQDGLDSTTGLQYWWEKFPAEGGRATTTYMFAFTDAATSHADALSTMARQYLQQLPGYLAGAASSTSGGSTAAQQVPLKRLLVGFVPCYPERVAPAADRVLPVGDSAGNRSALSLAGFCALVRHLPRLVSGVSEALRVGAVTAEELALLQPYCPGVATTGAMQRTMAVHSNQTPAIKSALAASTPAGGAAPAVDPQVVVQMVGGSFKAMWEAGGGEEGLRPFLADCISWQAISATLARQLQQAGRQVLSYHLFLDDSRSGPRLLGGLLGLAAHTALHAATPITAPLHELLLAGQPRLLYRWHRAVDAWRYGSGADWVPAAAQHMQAAQPGLQSVGFAAAAAAIAPEETGGGAVAEHQGDLASGPMASTPAQGQGVGSVTTMMCAPSATAAPRGPIIAAAGVGPAAAAGGEPDAAAAVDAAWLWDVCHSMDTYEDSLLDGTPGSTGSAPTPDTRWAAFGSLLAGASRAAAYQSQDTYEEALLLEGLPLQGSTFGASAAGSGGAAASAEVPVAASRGSSSSHEAAVAGALQQLSALSDASGAGQSPPWDATHSVGTYEDALKHAWDRQTAAADSCIQTGEPMLWSVDTHEKPLQEGSTVGAVQVSDWYLMHSQDTYEDSLSPGWGWDAAAAPGADPTHSVDTYEDDLVASAALEVVVSPPRSAPGSQALPPGWGPHQGAAAAVDSARLPGRGPVVACMAAGGAPDGSPSSAGPSPVVDNPSHSDNQGAAAGEGPKRGDSSSTHPGNQAAGNSSSSQAAGNSSSSRSGNGAGDGCGAAPKPGAWRGTWRPTPTKQSTSRRLTEGEQGHPDEGV